MRIAPLAHSALPDTEANVIRNLLEPCAGAAQHLKDREILEFLGDDYPGIPAETARSLQSTATFTLVREKSSPLNSRGRSSAMARP